MCGRFTNTLGPEELTKQLGESIGVRIRESASTDAWNVCPTDPVVTVVATDGVPETRTLRWSLVPPWASELKLPRPLFNARAEGLIERGNYAGVTPDAGHRGLVLADGFYEWEHPEDKKRKPQPYRFTVEDGRAFAFAAVWTTNRKIEGGPIESCSIITCDSAPNPLLSRVHDRMPVILTDPEELRVWLSPDVAPLDAMTLCRAFPAERMSLEAREPASQNSSEQLTILT
jgi:putative SOS response-associated peptidase YedK